MVLQKQVLPSQESLMIVKNNQPEVQTDANGKPTTVTPNNIARFMRGELTWAQVQGLSMQQVYSIAEIGYKLFMQGKYNDARTIFEGLIVLNPYDGYFYSVLGSIFAKQGKNEEALQNYTAAVHLSPFDIPSLINKAELLLKLGKFEEAFADLKKAIEVGEQNSNPAVIRAKALASATHNLISEILKSKSGQAG